MRQPRSLNDSRFCCSMYSRRQYVPSISRVAYDPIADHPCLSELCLSYSTKPVTVIGKPHPSSELVHCAVERLQVPSVSIRDACAKGKARIGHCAKLLLGADWLEADGGRQGHEGSENRSCLMQFHRETMGCSNAARVVPFAKSLLPNL